ncbi:ImmA/IrrE family metallo-endopeptidase [Enterococcus sp. AZ103]|uniref:ImmA/IrrE family metallo-endopeptidase n=1 Tax=Enterococcus sp. AZ103 TaxID=2774628 RepID=UPI003F270F45
MAKFEYRQINLEQYNDYSFKANLLLQEISSYYKLSIEDIHYKMIIRFFQENYNLHFCFYDVNPLERYGDNEWTKTRPTKNFIKYKTIIKGANFCFLDSDIVDRISGFTIPEKNRTLIMINQSCVKSRIIFTILHELCHFYFHIRNGLKKEIFVSLTNDKIKGLYSDEMLPYEDEANNIGSMLFCSEKSLEEMILHKANFKEMCHQTGMSEPAMHNRLLNYFQHRFKLNHSIALNYVIKFRNQNVNIINIICREVSLIQRNRADNDKKKVLSEIQADYIDDSQERFFFFFFDENA